MASIASKVLDFEAKAVEFTFAGQGPVLIALADFSEDVQLHFALHGISQKLGDSYSSAKGVVGDAMRFFEQTLAQLKAGDWRAARGEGESKPRTTELAAALARIKNQDIDTVAKQLAALTEEQRKAFRSNDRVKAVIAVIRAEKAQAKLDKMEEGEDELDLG
jgi:hypothetical protein